jgi:hypothetical protein
LEAGFLVVDSVGGIVVGIVDVVHKVNDIAEEAASYAVVVKDWVPCCAA